MTGVLVLLTVGTILLIALAYFASTFETAGQEARQAHERDRAEARLRPVGAVREDGEAAPVALAEDDEEEDEVLSASEVNEAACMACHDSGVQDAPITGDTDAWQALYDEKGLDELVDNAINGIGAMPARGGDSSLSDEEIRETVIYILEESGVSVDD